MDWWKIILQKHNIYCFKCETKLGLHLFQSVFTVYLQWVIHVIKINSIQIKYKFTFIVYTYISYLINIIYTIYTG